ncbi:MAG: hypothetical protein LBR50_08560 [Tannerella sp.]|jgi:hypothetical protein|nr:hypothetical protein [Tannerella sp.]
MKKIYFYLTIISALILHSLSVSAQDVYVAGNTNDGATVWQNGSVLYSFGNYTGANSIYVDGEDIYVAGFKSISGIESAVVWKNNKEITLASITAPTTLPTSPASITAVDSWGATAVSVIVYKGDVYALGYTYIGYTDGSNLARLDYTAKVWKNGEELYTIVNDSYEPYTGMTWFYSPAISSMSIYNGDVYVAGFCPKGTVYSELEFMSLWKNGEPVDASEEYKNASSVFVENGNVYVAGYSSTSTGYGATLWTNGQPRLLYPSYSNATSSFYSSATSVFVQNGKVYVGIYTETGKNVNSTWTYTYTPKIWTDYDEINIVEYADNYTNVNSVYVLDKVYAAVYEYNYSPSYAYAYVWSNGELNDISVGARSYPASIFVTPAPQPVPGLPRQVTLKVSGAYESDVVTGIYFVDSGDSFTFTVKPKTDGDEPVVTTTRKSSAVDKDYVVKPVGDGAYEITVYGINSPTTITVESSSPSAVAGIAALKVYASGNAIFIDAPTAGTAQIYAESGALVKTVTYGAGQTTVALTKGIYVVKTGNTVAKVVIN